MLHKNTLIRVGQLDHYLPLNYGFITNRRSTEIKEVTHRE
jgi:hypothetical protein